MTSFGCGTQGSGKSTVDVMEPIAVDLRDYVDFDLDAASGECVIAFGWAMAEALEKLA